jgi:putative redox protein
VFCFCQARGIDADRIKMRTLYTQNETTHLVEKARILIEVPDDFPKKYFAALERVVQMCAVKRSIANPPEFSIEVGEHP